MPVYQWAAGAAAEQFPAQEPDRQAEDLQATEAAHWGSGSAYWEPAEVPLRAEYK